MFNFQSEIKPGINVQCSYEEMHVNISADSFDKVDAAISIIELLISSVTVSCHFMQCNNVLWFMVGSLRSNTLFIKKTYIIIFSLLF